MLQPLKITPGAETNGNPGGFICVKTLIINHLSQIYNHMKILTAIGKGAGAILPILLVVSLGLELYDRFTERHHNKSISTTEPETEASPTMNEQI